MNNNIWEFMGIQRIDKTKSDKLLSNILNEMISSLCYSLEIQPSEYLNLHDFIKHGKKLNNEYSYFWDWMDELGYQKLLRISNETLPNTEDVLNFLNYRQTLLEMDIENGITSNLLLSISELLTAIDEYISVYYEQAISYQKYNEDLIDQIMVYSKQLDPTENEKKPAWKVTKDSAEKSSAESLFLFERVYQFG